MPHKPENIVDTRTSKELERRLTAAKAAHMALAAITEEVRVWDRSKLNYLKGLEGQAARFKGESLLLRFKGGQDSPVHWPKTGTLPADYYTVGKIQKFQPTPHQDELLIVRLYPCIEGDIAEYWALFDGLEPASLAEVNATERARQATAQQKA